MAVRHFGLLKLQIFNDGSGPENRTASLCQISLKSLVPRPRYGDFSIFHDGGRRHLEFLKFQIFNGRNGQEGRTASSCQISSKSLEPRPRYGDFSFDFLRWRSLPSWILKMSNRESNYFIVPNLVEITRTAAEIWRFFQDACVGTTHEGHLVICITVQNVVGIDAVVLIICTFLDFASLAWKRLFTPQNWLRVFWPPKWVAMWKKSQKDILARVRVVWAIMRENPSTGLSCRWVPQKGYK